MRNYQRDEVKRLLPLVWNESYAAWGNIEKPTRPDVDMPTATADPSHGNTLWALYADIRNAWKLAPLTLKEKRALFMRYAADWTEQEIGDHEGVTHRAVSYRIERGEGKLTAWLNGDKYVDGYDELGEDVIV